MYLRVAEKSKKINEIWSFYGKIYKLVTKVFEQTLENPFFIASNYVITDLFYSLASYDLEFYHYS